MTYKLSILGFLVGLVTLTFSATLSMPLTQTEKAQIAQWIFFNECSGKVEKLTSWNDRENFASLGIGHFIWYPAGEKKPFTESLPKLIQFAKSQTDIPTVLQRTNCPWQSKEAFDTAFSSPEMVEIRKFMVNTMPIQVEFMYQRLISAQSSILRGETSATQDRVIKQLKALSQTEKGVYALIDYTNFKGEGTNAKERYNGNGWGLKQVLLAMSESSKIPANQRFYDSAKFVLIRRVENSPQERQENLWLPGWLNRIKTYI